ncbi:glycosyltransferase [Paeniroseomonas aquatica]|uniref:Glycosyltransferase n=1 Tax=Paeniroseomonas aquatica TaxID=373043 RepID=A0ABT8ABK9_9PROT|nr:glycosyltransferase [Paeniroseomonas aquatica]MDN3567124.1 glycosyltransferase [Paeniroseomonas aquatica]
MTKPAGSPPDSPPDSSGDRTFPPWRRALGRLSGLLPRPAPAPLDMATLRRIEALERRIAQVEGQHALERDRVDWALALHEGLPDQIAAYQTARADQAYWAGHAAADPLVSVVVATADRTGTLLERAIPSALAQTHRNLQIVVIGDCAPAATERGLAAFRDGRIQFVNRAERGPYPPPGRDRWRVGGCLAMNEGLARSMGDFVTHLDDDDTMEPCRVEALLTAARQERADFLWHGLRFQLPDGSWMELGNGALEVGQVGTPSIFYHRYFARIPWDLQAYRASEPGDWNRLRKIKALRPRLHYVPQVLASHFADPSPPPFRRLPGERFLDD